jgi:Dyp-type peroxidase family
MQTTATATVELQFDDIQGVVLRERPSPYVGTYIFLRIDDPGSGRQMLARLAKVVNSAEGWWNADLPPLLNVGLTYDGLRALGLPLESLPSFPAEFRAGMAARAEILGDTSESAPATWEAPYGRGEIHVMLAIFATSQAPLAAALERAHQAHAELPGVVVVGRQEFYQLPNGRGAFGFKDGIGNPEIEGAGAPVRPGQGPPVKAGEFVLGYPDETGNPSPTPHPPELGRNGTYLAWLKLHTKEAQFRQFLRANASGSAEEELLAAKMIGRWRSGAPLMLSPEFDDPELGEDPLRNNDFLYHDQDPKGLICPLGAHARRMNPRDSLKDEVAAVNLHRMVRRGTNYGPALPDGALEDDGADRGIVFIFMGAHLDRQFEFVKSQWANDGNFAGLGAEQDPLVGAQNGEAVFTIPKTPVRRRLHGLPRFTVTRGGEYFFMPGIEALRWLSHPEQTLDTRSGLRRAPPARSPSRRAEG